MCEKRTMCNHEDNLYQFLFVVSSGFLIVAAQ